MAKVEIAERFTVHAASERVFRFLIDPERVVTCLPGAALTEIQDDTTFLGTVKVKVGPVTISYKGTIVLTQADADALIIEMNGTGTEKGGAGKASMVMKSRVVAVEGGSEVTVDAELDLAGKIVRFGRGMIKGVSKQLFGDFVKAVRARLEVEEAEAAAAQAHVAEAATSDTDAGDKGPVEAPVAVAVPDAPAGDLVAPGPRTLTAPQDVKPIGAFSLLMRTFWAGIKGVFRRLFGKKAPPT